MPEQQSNINVKISDEVLKGVYSNNLQISFTQEEFILDFMNIIPPQGIVNARVFVNPAHLKRIIGVLADTMKKYEEQFNEIKGAAPTNPTKIAESSKFGF